MDLDLRETLCSRIESIAPEYGLTECVYRSFLRSFGYRSTPISAGDAVEGLEALLSAAHGVRIEVDAPGLTFGGVGAGVGGVSGAYEAVVGRGMADQGSELFGSRRLWNLGPAGEEGWADEKENRAPDQPSTEAKEPPTQQERTSTRQSSWVRNYFTAYTALDTRKTMNVRLLQSSLSLSKALHRAVVSQGVALIDKQAIRTLRSFRLAILQDGPQLSLFTDPNLLIRLGSWLISALRDILKQQEDSRRQNKRSRSKKAMEEAALPTSLPFVLAALDETRNRYIVVGINGSREYGDVVRNRFGLAFQEAASKSGARTKHDRFETCAVEVGREDLAQFVESIHAVA